MANPIRLSQSVSLTWPVSFGSIGVQGFGPQGCTGFEFGFGELRQVRHHWVLIHVWIYDLLGSDHLDETKLESSDSSFVETTTALFCIHSSTSAVHMRVLHHEWLRLDSWMPLDPSSSWGPPSTAHFGSNPHKTHLVHVIASLAETPWPELGVSGYLDILNQKC